MQQSLSSETNIKLPFSFIFFSLLALVFSQIILLVKGQLLVGGSFRIPAIWSSAHLLILGWALMTAMGAMYQLVPVAFLTKIWNEQFGFLQFFVTATGITFFSGTLYFSPQNALIPGVITLTGILMFLFQMVMTLRQQAKPTIFTAFVGGALIALFLTISLGISMVYFLKTGAGSTFYQSFFKMHLLMGVTGWFTLLIFGFSYKMVPMFSLAHGFPMRQARFVFGFYLTGLLLTLLSFLINNTVLLVTGFFFLFVGFSTFSYHIWIILKKRLKKKLDISFSFALGAIGFGNLIHLLAFVLLFTDRFPLLIGPLLYAYLLLWIVLSIFGYLFKIVPFLWWTHKYSSQIGKQAVPSLKEMMNEKVTLPLFSAFVVSAIIVGMAIAFKIAILFTIGQAILSVVFILMAAAILTVLKK